MWNRAGIRSSALERAKAQLSGQRVTNSGTLPEVQRRDVGSFGKALQSRPIPLHDLSDLSLDTEREKLAHQAHPVQTMPHIAEPFEQSGMGGGRRFLKKSANKVASPADTSEDMFIPQRGSHNVALSRLALIEARIRNRTNSKLSVDAGADLKSSLSVLSSTELSTADRSSFLKRKASTPIIQKESERPCADICMASPELHAHAKSISKDSDEGEMRRLLGGLFESSVVGKDAQQRKTSPQQAVEASRKSSKEAEERSKKQPVYSAFTGQHHMRLSPSPPSSCDGFASSRPYFQTVGRTSEHHHSEIESLEELFSIASDHDDTQSERSVLSDDFKLNVMTLDDLAPGTFDVAELSETKCDAKPKQLGVSSAVEVLQKPEDEAERYESDFESEIQTETAPSVDDISEHLSGEIEHSLASEPQSERESAKLYSDANTLPEKSASTSYSRSGSSLSGHQVSDTSSDSRGAAHAASSPQSPGVRRCKKDATVQTQTEGLAYVWPSDRAMLASSVGRTYVDPMPIASHMISAEAVEALTAYSPAVFALNDMLRQQLTLTKSFIQSSRHLRQVMLESLGPANYRYTTLEDTKEFIRRNRPPKLTVEDALEEVLQEMRDYHYI